jgi:hypothetical protein
MEIFVVGAYYKTIIRPSSYRVLPHDRGAHITDLDPLGNASAPFPIQKGTETYGMSSRSTERGELPIHPSACTCDESGMPILTRT